MAEKEEKTRNNRNRKSSKRKSTGLALGVFVLGVLIIIVAFIVMWPTIAENLGKTNFFERLGMETPEYISKYQQQEESANGESSIITSDSEIIIQIEPEKTTLINKDTVKEDKVEVENKVSEEKTSEPVVAEEKKEPKTEEKAPTVPIDEKKAPDKEEKTPVVSTVIYTDLSLCFIQVDSEGSILRKMVKRSVPKNDSPLTTAILLLLDGPEASKSSESDCLTLIPDGTKLLSARVQDGIAYLNFNDCLERNPDGVEGYINSLMQIVYTSTSFSTVKSVQFLIEGQKKDFLGDGQWIGSPLSRSSF